VVCDGVTQTSLASGVVGEWRWVCFDWFCMGRYRFHL